MDIPLKCPKCAAALGEEVVASRSGRCLSCGSVLELEVYPALFRGKATGQSGEGLVLPIEAGCFYHPDKRAVEPCVMCGRFLCQLCDCELEGEHFCPTCLEIGAKKGRIKKLENQRILYDNIALALVIYPVILLVGVYFIIFTAPLALYFAIRFWNAPGSLIHRTKTRYVVAILLATLELAGWGAMVYFLTRRSRG